MLGRASEVDEVGPKQAELTLPLFVLLLCCQRCSAYKTPEDAHKAVPVFDYVICTC